MIRALWLPLSLSLLSFLVGVFFGNPLALFLSLFPTTVFLMDARGRHRDYLWLRSLPHKTQLKYVSMFMKTRCSREVMTAIDPFFGVAYYQQGYRWYHLLPDQALSRNSPFFRKSFWKVVFNGRNRI